ncbi:MAG TPA: MBL fold metallo-hydrolase [Solirubrobacteraceae bacterium]
MQVTVLGKSPSWQDAAGACSGYLAQQDGGTVLLDCGNGVFSKLRGICDYVDVDAVVISHMHADHFLDLVPFSYALRYAPRQQPVPVGGWPGTDNPARPRLYLPAGGGALLRRVVSCWGTEDLIDAAFDVHEYDAGDTVTVGTLNVRFCEVPHYVATFAVELACERGRFTFGADCRPNEELVDFARDTDVLLIEATLPRPERDGHRGHLTAREAGEHGRFAGARRLVLTHYSDELDPELTKSQAAESYGGPVDLAREGATYTV